VAKKIRSLGFWHVSGIRHPLGRCRKAPAGDVVVAEDIETSFIRGFHIRPSGNSADGVETLPATSTTTTMAWPPLKDRLLSLLDPGYLLYGGARGRSENGELVHYSSGPGKGTANLY
jgi:hypothetical protein